MVSIRDAESRRNDYLEADLTDLPQRIDDLRGAGDVVAGDLHDLLGVGGAPRRYPTDRPVFAVLGYEAAAAAFRANDVYSSFIPDTGLQGLGANILVMDEPEHRRYRTLAQPAFAAKTMTDWEHRWLAPTLERLMDQLPSTGRVDLYADYCAKFPVETIVGGFGIPPHDAQQFHVWALQFSGGAAPEEAARAVASFDAYLDPIIDERRKSPTDDVIGLLANSEITDDEGTHTLTNEEVLGFARLMILAGAGTTYRTFGFLMMQMAMHPEAYERSRHDRAFREAAVEETLRWSPPVTYFMRNALADSELAGVHIPAGSLVQVAVGAANRDPSRWDDPHRWDPTRPLQAHLAFGFGPHFCIGNQLARTELRVALERLLDRYSTIRLDPDAPEPRIDGLLYRFLRQLPVVLG